MRIDGIGYRYFFRPYVRGECVLTCWVYCLESMVLAPYDMVGLPYLDLGCVWTVMVGQIRFAFVDFDPFLWDQRFAEWQSFVRLICNRTTVMFVRNYL